MLLFSASCKRTQFNEAAMWIGNADLHDYEEAVHAFIEAASLDPSCQGVHFYTQKQPPGPHWFLEVYAVRAEFNETDTIVTWWMTYEKPAARVDGSNESYEAAAKQYVLQWNEEEPKLTERQAIGILALQGAFDAHARMLQSLGAETVLVRKPEQLDGLDGLVIPGGESTTFLKHLERAGFFDALATFVRTKPAFGTCAGVILMAKRVLNPPQRSLEALDVTVERNAYGRQNDSRILEAETSVPGGPIEMVYIRAPRITEIGPGVETLAERDGFPTLVRQGHLLAATFHPELAHDTRVHQLFLDAVKRHAETKSAA